MVRKQLDERIPALIRHGVAAGHRSVFVLVGDHARDQVVNLHYFLSQTRVSARPNVLWCYKKELGFSSNRQKRERELKRSLKKGTKNKEELANDPFALFVGVTDISYRYYKDSDKILGNTYGMLVLQDFEALTPNLLARTIETVEGGGIVVFLLKTMTNLRQLYSLSMDVHAKYRSHATLDEPVARFNERFLLSLSTSSNCLICDDELNVLPLSKGGRAAQPDSSDMVEARETAKSERAAQLAQLRNDVSGTQVVSDLLSQAATHDQGLSILTMLDILSSAASGGDLSTTFALTAARGRGKSAALGLSIAAALAYGYSNIFVTSPSPANLRTLFQFLVKGLSALGYAEGSDWSLVKGAPGTDLKDTILRVNVQRQQTGGGSSASSKQVVQYISPDDAGMLGYNAELVVIDEAAAIPLPLVRDLMGQGQYLVFLSSTISGYEGTGRSLSLKLLEQLRSATGSQTQTDAVAGLGLDQATGTSTATTGDSKRLTPGQGSALAPVSGGIGGTALHTRQLREYNMTDPIRYAAGDPVETWLTKLLCLDASVASQRSTTASSASAEVKKRSAPHPSTCELYQVNRDSLFSFHPTSEKFLQEVMALYASAHYKNSPNDLQLLSDAPGQRLFVLCDPQPRKNKGLPHALCVVQVALEGALARNAILSGLARGTREAGDLIPWLISSYYQDSDFAQLSGARVVRIATHPDYARMGYATRAMDLLKQFYQGNLLDADALVAREEAQAQEDLPTTHAQEDSKRNDGEEVAVRSGDKLPALLQYLHETRPEAVDWIGVSYGLSATLFRFWRKLGFTPLYVRQTPAAQTGEFTCVQVRPIVDPLDPHDADADSTNEGEEQAGAWLAEYAEDFRRRFSELLGYRFRTFAATLAYQILQAAVSTATLQAVGNQTQQKERSPPLTLQELRFALSAFDLKRLESFGDNMVEMYVVTDLFPKLAQLYFTGRLRAAATEGVEKPLHLSAVQATTLLAIGLQRKDTAEVSAELLFDASQLSMLLVQAVRHVVQSLRLVQATSIAQDLDRSQPQIQIQDRVPTVEQELKGSSKTKKQFAQADSNSTPTQEQNGQKSDGMESATESDNQDEDPDGDEDEDQDGDEDEDEDEEEAAAAAAAAATARRGGGQEDAPTAAAKEQQRELIAQLHLDKYRIDPHSDWAAAEERVREQKPSLGLGQNTTLSVKRPAPLGDDGRAAPPPPPKKAARGGPGGTGGTGGKSGKGAGRGGAQAGRRKGRH